MWYQNPKNILVSWLLVALYEYSGVGMIQGRLIEMLATRLQYYPIVVFRRPYLWTYDTARRAMKIYSYQYYYAIVLGL